MMVNFYLSSDLFNTIKLNKKRQNHTFYVRYNSGLKYKNKILILFIIVFLPSFLIHSSTPLTYNSTQLASLPSL